jgi:hypothetical protein
MEKYPISWFDHVTVLGMAPDCDGHEYPEAIKKARPICRAGRTSERLISTIIR